MLGTLELLCGPSGVGKTTSIDKIVKSYRWTTRQKREGEIDSREYNGTESTQGFFVSEQEFKEKVEKEELIGIHRYPDSENGDLYGFPINEIKEALKKEENVYEQITYYDVIEPIVKKFEGNNIKKILFLSDYTEIKKRLVNRSKTKKEYDDRLRKTLENIKKYLFNINLFDEIKYVSPKLLNHEESVKVLEEMISNLKNNVGFVLEYDYGKYWNEGNSSIYGNLLDSLIIFNMLESKLKGEQTKEIIDPTFQFNLAYDFKIEEIKRRIESSDLKMIRILYEEVKTDIKNLEKEKITMISFLERIRNQSQINLQKTYLSNYKNVLDISNEVSSELTKKGMSDIASIIQLINLYSIISREKKRELEKKFEKHIKSVISNGFTKENDFISVLLNKNLIQALENREGVIEKIKNPIDEIDIYPRKMSKIYLDKVSKNSNELNEFNLSRSVFDLKFGLNLLSLYTDFTKLIEDGKCVGTDFLLPRYLVSLEEAYVSNLQYNLVLQLNIQDMYIYELKKSYEEKVEAFGEQINYLKRLNNYHISFNDFEKKK